MEGPNLRSGPRTLFSCQVELRAGKKSIRMKEALGNLSIHGLFLHAEALPKDSSVHIKIAATPPAELDGIIRSCDPDGIHIEFTDLTEERRRRIDDLIAEFTIREPLPSSAPFKSMRKGESGKRAR